MHQTNYFCLELMFLKAINKCIMKKCKSCKILTHLQTKIHHIWHTEYNVAIYYINTPLEKPHQNKIILKISKNVWNINQTIISESKSKTAPTFVCAVSVSQPTLGGDRDIYCYSRRFRFGCLRTWSWATCPTFHKRFSCKPIKLQNTYQLGS